MSNLAHISDHERFEVREAPRQPRGPHLEEGYTQVANNLLEDIMAAPLTLREMRVVLAIIRLTYGWNRKEARITGGLLAKLTGMPATKVSKTLAGLVAKNVVVRHGGSRSPVSLNKYVDQWRIEETSRVTPPPKQKAEIDQNGENHPKRYDSYQNGKSECDQNGNASKDRKDITSTDVEERIGKPKREASSVDGEKPKTSRLPTCPHMEILDLWAEIMPDKRQHSKTMWHDSARAKNLAARWAMGFTRKHADTGKPFYSTLEEGIDWWGRFFKYLRKNEFLMQDHRWFDLGWVVKRENFIKIIERNYEEGA